MTRPSGVFKQDRAARMAWGNAYDAIPKSVFALAAWHLANVASGQADTVGAAESRMIEELEALRYGHLPQTQADRAIKAIHATAARSAARSA
ncbi:hypothetical protein GGQ99_001340 [Aminobacter niigataensis]|uniref:Uncharacterized protein n=1 Tax=Aminobacter niigataensis TaxID=83265 RepID=A0ABR6KYX7_9HYPH|nr:hypothetical protein [Aminobacter niigataensis]MBB4649618.1 hypothetical protein [Aminobacter niigataensis]